MKIDPPHSAEKAELRDYFSNARRALSDDQYRQYSQEICRQLLSYLIDLKSEQPSAIHLHLFLPIEAQREVDLRPLLPHLWQYNIRVAVPRVKQGALEHIPLTAETKLKTSRWGIPEPTEDYNPLTEEEINSITTVITPLLTCDIKGHRVGYGGGFYDQFFKTYPHLIKIGVGFFPPIEKILDSYPGDIPLNYYLYPKELIRF